MKHKIQGQLTIYIGDKLTSVMKPSLRDELNKIPTDARITQISLSAGNDGNGVIVYWTLD